MLPLMDIPPVVNPDKTDLFKWNSEWERYLERRYKPSSFYPPLSFTPDAASMMQTQFHMQLLAAHRKELLENQFDLAQLVFDKRTEDQFDSKWRAMTSEDMELRRQWCPDTKLELLEKNNGKGFLDLLATICPMGRPPSPAANPTLIGHPVFDEMLYIGRPCPVGVEKAVLDGFQRFLTYNRNVFLCLFLSSTVLHVYGQEQGYKPVRTPTSGKMMAESVRMFDQRPGSGIPFSEAEKRKMVKDKHDAYKAARYACVACFKLEEDLPSGPKFLHCSKCRGIGRKVPYCGKECQVFDWKQGNPPHKTICGKDLPPPTDSLETTPVTEATESLEGLPKRRTFPDPAPGFNRTTELLVQLDTLSRNAHVHYVLTSSWPASGIEFHSSETAASFKMMVDRASYDGDPRAVSLIGKYLMPQLPSGITRQQVLAQLSTEYVLPVSTVETKWKECIEKAPVTREEAVFYYVAKRAPLDE